MTLTPNVQSTDNQNNVNSLPSQENENVQITGSGLPTGMYSIVKVKCIYSLLYLLDTL